MSVENQTEPGALEAEALTSVRMQLDERRDTLRRTQSIKFLLNMARTECANVHESRQISSLERPARRGIEPQRVEGPNPTCVLCSLRRETSAKMQETHHGWMSGQSPIVFSFIALSQGSTEQPPQPELKLIGTVLRLEYNAHLNGNACCVR